MYSAYGMAGWRIIGGNETNDGNITMAWPACGEENGETHISASFGKRRGVCRKWPACGI